MKKPDKASRLSVRNRPVGRKPVMYQTWKELLFLHWEIDPQLIQKTLPEGLYVDTFEGKAYIGLVPFFMLNIRPTWFFSVPGISNFLEVNVRTYVHDKNGVPGVWFYSLDANQSLAVWLARTFFKLPYYNAKMSAKWNAAKDALLYTSERKGTSQKSTFNYVAKQDLIEASYGTLDFFLLERYILFSWNSSKKKLMKGQVFHTPYQYANTEVYQWDDTLLRLNQFSLPNEPPLLMQYASGVDVDVFAIEPV
jgi:uncharacterized protein YqjF (DUF2071 family)